MHPPTETDNKNYKMKDAKKYTAIHCMTCRTGCRSSWKFWLDIETLPVSRAKVEPGSGKHSVHTHFPTDPNFDISLKKKK